MFRPVAALLLLVCCIGGITSCVAAKDADFKSIVPRLLPSVVDGALSRVRLTTRCRQVLGSINDLMAQACLQRPCTDAQFTISVLNRLGGGDGHLECGLTKKELWDAAEDLLDKERNKNKDL